MYHDVHIEWGLNARAYFEAYRGLCRIRHAYAISKIWAWSEIPVEKRIVFWTKVEETRVFVNLILTKELLCIDDATLVKIKDYDNEKTQEELEKARERERIRQEEMKKSAEQKEYQQYLRFKEKFEKKEVSK